MAISRDEALEVRRQRLDDVLPKLEAWIDELLQQPRNGLAVNLTGNQASQQVGFDLRNLNLATRRDFADEIMSRYRKAGWAVCYSRENVYSEIVISEKERDCDS